MALPRVYLRNRRGNSNWASAAAKSMRKVLNEGRASARPLWIRIDSVVQTLLYFCVTRKYQPTPPKIYPNQCISVRNPFRMSSSEKSYFNPFRITISGDKDLKSFRINTSKKHPGVGGYTHTSMYQFFRSSLCRILVAETRASRE
jgi:hypothetical protein